MWSDTGHDLIDLESPGKQGNSLKGLFRVESKNNHQL
jgi:hypothetical protein